MTLKNRYREAMERIEVTEEMRARIRKNLETAQTSAPKTVQFPKRWLSLAACLAVLVVGVLALPHLQKQTEPPDMTMQTPQIEEVSSAEELSRLVGFPVQDVTGLPFTPETVNDTAYWNELAQITYTGSDGQTAVFRKSVGAEDNSGDFNDYPDVREADADGRTVTLKGRDGLYVLAVWSWDGYAYSLSLSDGLPASAWTVLAASIS